MKNNKGFTLVELLAVIAILAILVIIALPNVLKLYNNAKKNIFLTEAKNIYKSSANKYVTESRKGKIISFIDSKNNGLGLTNEKDLEYCINLNEGGSVKNLVVLDSNYYIEYDGSTDISEYDLKDVKEKQDNTKLICSKNSSKIVNVSPLKKCSSDNTSTYSDSTYTYKSTNKGWTVKLTNPDSTEPIVDSPCSTINDMPIISMKQLFDKSKVSSIDVSGFNTSDVTDMNGMFANTAATEIKGLEYLDTSKVTDMKSMFEGVSVESLDLTGFDTSSVKYMASMFSGAKAKTIDTSNFNTSNVINMHRMFYYTTNLDKIDLSSFDTSNVQLMSAMFMGSTVTKIDGLNKLNTSKVTSMDSMFRMCKLKVLDLSSFDTHSVTTMGQMFDWAEAETIIGLEKFDTSNVTNMGQMFESCSTKNLNLSSFDTTNVTNMGRMFDGNKAETIDLSSFDVSNIGVDKMDNMFRNCKSKTIYVKDQASLDKFNSSSNKSSSFEFIIKSN